MHEHDQGSGAREQDGDTLDLLGEEDAIAEELLDDDPIVGPFDADGSLSGAMTANGVDAELDEAPSEAPPSASTEQRLVRLESAARALAAAEVEREQRRVRRKVCAATTGAGTLGFIPLLLQLAGAFDLSPELSAAVSTGAAIVGALGAGWATPERTPPLQVPVAQRLIAPGTD